MSSSRTGARTFVPALKALLTSTAAAVGLLAPISDLSAQAQQIGLARSGPVDPANGYPVYYEDSNGLRLGLCTDPNSCFWALPDAGLPAAFPTNWPNEGFYFAAQASMSGGGANMLYLCALEAAFSQGPVAAGDQVVFTRIRIRITGLVDGATYTLSHPYGVDRFVAGVDGALPGSINVTRDFGLGAPGDFAQALHGNVGPFLTTLGFGGAGLPGAFISDGATLTTVQGSPLGTNYVRLEGPGVDTLFPANANGVGRAQIDAFVLQGQVAQRLGATIDKAYAERSAEATVVNVWAQSSTGQSLVAEAAGVSRAMIPGADGRYFTRLELGAGAAVPPQITVTNITDLPPTSWTKGPIPDAVAVQSAIYTVGGDLVVTASSTDSVTNPALTVSAANGPSAVLAPIGGGIASGGLGLPLGTIPPHTVVVRSANGGVDEAPVIVRGIGVPGGAIEPVVANAGPDATVQTGTAVALNGAASTGPIATFAWSQDAGVPVTLIGGDSAQPLFLAPVVAAGAQLDLGFTLTVHSSAGAVSSDSVLVHVQGPPIVVPPSDVVTVRDARYSQRNVSWRASGTTSLVSGQTITIYLGPIHDRTRRLGSAVVDPTGAWSMQQANNSAPFRPATGDTTVWAESSLPGTPGSIVFRRQ